MSLRSWAIVFAAATLLFAVIVLHDRYAPRSPLIRPNGDFSAFYCAGRAVRERKNPYHFEPLRSCEAALPASEREPHWFVTPAPYPGYAMAFFALVAAFPADIARLVWTYLIALADAVIVVTLAAMTGFAWLAIAPLVVPGLLLYDIQIGAFPPIAAALLCLAAACAYRGAWNIAGALLPLALIQPLLAVPPYLAALAFAPRLRAPLLRSTALLAAVSFTSIGPSATFEYFRTVLPLQAAAEVHYDSQFSLTHVLALAGVPDAAALAIGSASALVMTIAGIRCGRRLQTATGNPAFLLLVPSALGLIGGTYVHDTQIETALCAAVLIASIRTVPRWISVLPLLLLAMLWDAPPHSKLTTAVLLLSTIAATAIALNGVRAGVRRGALAYVTIPLVLFAIYTAMSYVPGAPPNLPDPSTAAGPPEVADANASAYWAAALRTIPYWTAGDPRYEVQKIPVWAGLLAMLAFALRYRAPAEPLRG